MLDVHLYLFLVLTYIMSVIPFHPAAVGMAKHQPSCRHVDGLS
jgi:hypothetical protein